MARGTASWLRNVQTEHGEGLPGACGMTEQTSRCCGSWKPTFTHLLAAQPGHCDRQESRQGRSWGKCPGGTRRGVRQTLT